MIAPQHCHHPEDLLTIDQLRRAVQACPNAGTAHRLACALRRVGRSEEALMHFRHAARLAPGDVVVQANLAQMLLNIGRHAAAVSQCRRAVSLRPDMAILHLILGDALRCSQRYDEAHAAYLEALRLQPELAPAHANLGLLFLERDDFVAARHAFCQAIAIDPSNASYWKYEAMAHAGFGSVVDGLACWQRAVALTSADPAMHLGLAAALQAAGRLDEGEECVQAALRLQPNNPEAHVALGDVYEQRGDKEGAEAAFRAALRLQPDFAFAHVRLVALLEGRASDADRAAIESCLRAAGKGRSPATCRTRILLLHALAVVHDRHGDYPQAAAYARQMNALSVAETQRRGKYSPAKHRALVDGLIRAFDSSFCQRMSGAGLATTRPIFIVGLPRSGTTLVEQILASHPRVHGGGELRLGRQSLLSIPEAVGCAGADPLACAPWLNADSLRRLASQHLANLAAVDGGGAERITDKMPSNYLYLGLLASMFPNAVFIHCRRDLRDVALSCWITGFKCVDWTNDIGHIRSHMAEYLRLMEHWRRVLPVTVHEVVYEELVADLDGGARRVLAACNLDWDPACLDFHRNRRAVQTASAAQVRTPIYSRSVGRWQNYVSEVPELFAGLEPTQASRPPS